MDSSKANPCPDCGAGQGELHLPECIWVGDQWTPEQLASFKRDSVTWTGVATIDQQLLKQREAGEPIDMLKASVAARIAKLDTAPPAETTSQTQTTFDWRHEAVARALAQADGHDPDLKVVDVRSAKAGPFGSLAASAVQPAWHCYLQMAAGIVSALAAAK